MKSAKEWIHRKRDYAFVTSCHGRGNVIKGPIPVLSQTWGGGLDVKLNSPLYWISVQATKVYWQYSNENSDYFLPTSLSEDFVCPAKKVASASWPNDSDRKRIMGDSDSIFVPFEKRAICRSYTLLCLDPTGMILYGLLV